MSKDIGKNIKEQRVLSGMTQEDLGNKLGYSPQAISGWETGARKVRAEEINRIADALRVDVGLLYGGSSVVETVEKPEIGTPATQSVHLRKVHAIKMTYRVAMFLGTTVFALLASFLDLFILQGLFILCLIVYCLMEIVVAIQSWKNDAIRHFNLPIEASLFFIHEDGVIKQKKNCLHNRYMIPVSLLSSLLAIISLMAFVNGQSGDNSLSIVVVILFLLSISLHIYLVTMELRKLWLEERIPLDSTDKRFFVGRFRLNAVLNAFVFFLGCTLLMTYRQMATWELKWFVVLSALIANAFSIELLVRNYWFYSRFYLFSQMKGKDDLNRLL